MAVTTICFSAATETPHQADRSRNQSRAANGGAAQAVGVGPHGH